MDTAINILIVEDDTAISLGLRDAFEEELYHVTVAKDGGIGLSIARGGKFGCIILDLMLPTMNGREICRALRSEGITTPILMLTSKSAESDMILGLELGADDYMAKPFSIRELMARVRALLRRRMFTNTTYEEFNEFRIGNVMVDFKKREIITMSNRVPLLAKEFEILQYFCSHVGKVISREVLLNEVWGYENFPTTRTVDNYILGLRKKIEKDPSSPKHLITIHTVGYKLLVVDGKTK